MVAPSVGSVVLIPFPFSDLSASKLRPAVVVASAGNKEWTLCMVTSNPYADSKAIKILSRDFDWGGLHQTSYARPLKLFTAHESLMVREVGRLRKERREMIIEVIVKSLRP